MGTQTRPEGKARIFGENIESDLASRFLRVVEVAAIASARTMGQGERKLSDQVATEAMRRTMDSIPMRLPHGYRRTGGSLSRNDVSQGDAMRSKSIVHCESRREITSLPSTRGARCMCAFALLLASLSAC